jgi:hypothetical protein
MTVGLRFVDNDPATTGFFLLDLLELAMVPLGDSSGVPLNSEDDAEPIAAVDLRS